MTYEEYNRKCKEYGLDLPIKFYLNYFIPITEGVGINDDFFVTLKKFTEFEEPNVFTVCKLFRFMEKIYLDDEGKNMKPIMYYCKLLGDRMGKRMQMGLERHK